MLTIETRIGNFMKQLISHTTDAFYQFRFLFSGYFIQRPKNEEMEKISFEVYNLNIPTLKQDKTNLKADRDIVATGLRKAVDEKLLELNGETSKAN